ncbi:MULTISPECIES: hypothetical protein [Streptomyces]|uniref:Uncharacterized protein n=1 Tax=Streptomyces flaveolus TaxID=67297 RepID=A0ABV3AF54_9ACTN|nr:MULTISPECIES: hypothetical protein [Streptomyces]
MHHPARTAPRSGSARRSAVAVLAGVVVMLLAAVGLAGPATTGGSAAVAAAAAGHYADAGPHADDGCGLVRIARAASRQDPHREPPAPHCHPAPCPQGTTVTPPRPAGLTESTGHVPSSGCHAPPDRGRAPPGASGT